MKKIPIIAALLLFSYNIYAQRYREIVMWEVETRMGELLFGISETKDGADVVMYNFQKRNADTKYDITNHPAKYNFTTVPVEHANDNPIDNFKSKMGGKLYKVLSKEAIVDFKIAKSKGSAALVAYYLGTKTRQTETKQTETKVISNVATTNTQIKNNKKIYQEIVLWEVETRIDGLLFGIAKTKDEADAVMADFQKRNANSKYDISRYPAKYKFITVQINDLNENPINKFKSYAGKAYKVLSVEDLKGIEIAKRKGLEAGVNYYVDIRGADRSFATKRLKGIMKNLDAYRIQSSGYLASTVD